MQKILLALVATAATTSFALPSAYVKNSNLKTVKAESSASTLIADTQDPNKVWVLPPSAGQATVKSLVATGNAGFCQGMKSLIAGVNDLDAQRVAIAKSLRTSEQEAKQLAQTVRQRRNELAAIGDLPGGEDMKRLVNEIEELEEKIDELREKVLEVETKEEREEIRAAIKEAKAERKEKKADLKAVRKEHRDTYKKLTKAQKLLKAAEENLKKMNEHVKILVKDLTEITDDILGTFGQRAKLLGASAMIDYDSHWSQEIAKLQSSYGSLNFAKIPTYSARVHAGFIHIGTSDSYFSQLPPVAAYNVNGKPGLPYGERKKQDDPERAGTAFPEIVAADLGLNLIGACPALDKDFFSDIDFKVKRDTDGVPVYAISTTYEYDAASTFEVKASYNLWSFYEKIVTKTTRGGFFSRRSFVDILESKLGDDKFKIEIIDAGDVPAEKIEQIRKQIKAELMSRVLTAVARPTSGSKVIVPSHDLPPQSGAVVLAKGLGKLCGANVYCQAGGWILRVGDAIFGSTTAQTRFRQSWNHTAREHWKSTKLVPKQGMTTYRR